MIQRGSTLGAAMLALGAISLMPGLAQAKEGPPGCTEMDLATINEGHYADGWYYDAGLTNRSHTKTYTFRLLVSQYPQAKTIFGQRESRNFVFRPGEARYVQFGPFDKPSGYAGLKDATTIDGCWSQ